MTMLCLYGSLPSAVEDDMVIKVPTAPGHYDSIGMKFQRFLLVKQLQSTERFCWPLMVNVNCVCERSNSASVCSSRWA